MGYLVLENISTDYCLQNIDLAISEGEFVVVIGHSGAGKSTLLNILAGFVSHSGNLYLKGKKINRIPAQHREFGYLHQDIHLFPHLNVFENIAFGLRATGTKGPGLATSVNTTMDMLGIRHLADRYPKNLSGGEKQRVGIARAIIKKPHVLLLDEPLSSLDVQTADGIRKEIKTLQRELNLTVVYVTHNLVDADTLAQKVVSIQTGKIKEIVSKKHEVPGYSSN